MFAKTKETKTPKYALLTALIALAVLISLATAGKASAAESDIKSIEYKPAKTEFVCGIGDTYLNQDVYDNGYGGFLALDHFNPQCLVNSSDVDYTYEEEILKVTNIIPESHLIFNNDKLIITREDGTVQTLSPHYIVYHALYDPSDQSTCSIAWFDENNKITDVATEYSWNNKPEVYVDDNVDLLAYKPGIYDNTVTVKVGDKSTTFKKRIIVRGKSFSSYDKTVPVINNKKITTEINKLYKKGNKTVIDYFRIKWPKNKSAHSYTVKLKQIYPERIHSSKYKIINAKFGSKYYWLVYWSSSLIYAATLYDYDINLTDNQYLTADTMMEISVCIVKKSNLEKTGSNYVYGKYSKPVRLFLSKNKTLKAKGKKRSVKLTWSKVYRASGYKIKYSTKKNMSKAKTIKVKGGNKKAYTIKKLKKNKKYYFQITPYKVYKGKTYTGYASVKKAAKAK